MSSRTPALALIALTVAAFGSLMGLRDSLSWVTGDEGTYMAMAESLARDGDLLFGSEDLARLDTATLPGERDLILQRTRRGITYSKPVLYALAAAPMQWFASSYGPILLNLIAMGTALWLTLLYLRRIGEHDLLTLVTFAGTSVLLPYLAWRMSDALLVSCTLAGLVLSLAAVRGPERRWQHARHFLDSPWASIAGGLLLGAAAAMRYPNALLAVAAFTALVARRRWTRASYFLAGVAVAVVLTVGATTALTGAPDPYRTPRATFNPAVGFPDGPDSEVATAQLGGNELATVRLRTELRPRVVAYSTLYYFVGRHTGLLIYFPAAIVFLILALRRPDAVGLSMVAAVAGISAFYLLLLPHNYFGGGAAIGNRYFLAAYPALLVALRELPRPRWLIAPWVIAIVALGSALVSVWQTRDSERNSQVHAHAGIFRLLPYESTLQSIEGSRERFWLHDWGWEMLHFNDPFARVGSFSFFLDGGAPPAEVEIANTRSDGLMRFLVLSEAPEIEFEFRDWQRSESVRLERPVGARGMVEIQASPAWRQHPLWFHWRLHDVFHARVARLAIKTPDGSPARAEVRYLGPATIPEEIYAREVIDSELPTLAGAGTTSIAAVTVRNDSAEVWKSQRVLAVFLSYRLFERTEQGVRVTEGGRHPLPGPVAPGEIFRSELEIQWPPVPGRYGLAVDLVHEGISWFEERVGSPLARSEVRVVELPKAEPLDAAPPSGEDAP